MVVVVVVAVVAVSNEEKLNSREICIYNVPYLRWAEAMMMELHESGQQLE
jgi:hypothetical protein